MKNIKCPCCGKRVAKSEENCPFCLYKLTPFTPEEEERFLKRALKQIFSPIGYFMADFTIIKAAARKGNAQAQSCMGDVYVQGFEHIHASRIKAKKWYRKAAAQGYEPAIDKLRQLKDRQWP